MCYCNQGSGQKHHENVYTSTFLGLSKWIDAHVLTTANSANTIVKQCTKFATFGLPETLVSDNGTAFTSAECTAFLFSNGIRHSTTTPSHASSNGLAETAVQTTENILLKHPAAPCICV
ncbi:unnamed protein product [Dicrocoelium dendriticum]|nr:unnamed protein product [Dicrocoelium dendriticum]